MNKCVIIGSGGHCRALISILRKQCWENLIGIIDINEPRLGEIILNVPVLGGPDVLMDLCEKASVDALIAIGNNSKRCFWLSKAKNMGCRFPNLIAESAIIDITARLGEGLFIAEHVFIGPEVMIGDGVIVNTGGIVEHETVVEDFCHIAPGAIISGRSKLGEGSFLGANATIIDKTNVAPNTVIGACSVVVKTILEPGGTWVGIPARRAK